MFLMAFQRFSKNKRISNAIWKHSFISLFVCEVDKELGLLSPVHRMEACSLFWIRAKEHAHFSG